MVASAAMAYFLLVLEKIGLEILDAFGITIEAFRFPGGLIIVDLCVGNAGADDEKKNVGKSQLTRCC